MGDHATFDIMDLYLLNLGTLVPKGPCCVFMQQCAKLTEI